MALQRPGSVLARRPLHFVVLADCSGSMAADGKIQALNTALRETVPHLAEVAMSNPHAEVLVRAIAFSTGARWHLEQPTPADQLRWTDLSADGYTDLGAALRLLREVLSSSRMEERALPPALVLVSDGMPTDDYRHELGLLLAEPWGARSVRASVGIGRDADHDMLQAFMGDEAIAPVSAKNPEQLVRMLRWATSHTSRLASSLPPAARPVPQLVEPDDADEVVW